MKSFFSCCLVAFFCHMFTFNGAPDTLWTRTFGGSVGGCSGWEGDGIRSVQQTDDGGYVLCGWKNDEEFDADIWLIRTNELGYKDWERTYNNPYLNDNSVGHAVKITHDNGYFIIGNKKVIYMDYAYTWLIRTDELGDTIWTRKCKDRDDFLDHHTFDGIISNNGYILVGSGKIYSINDFGDTLWANDDNFPCNGYSIDKIDANNLVVTGLANNRIFLVKINDAGDMLWTKQYELGDWCEGKCVKYTGQEQIVIAANVEIHETLNNNSKILSKIEGVHNYNYLNDLSKLSHFKDQLYNPDVAQVLNKYNINADEINEIKSEEIHRKIYLLCTNLDGDTLWSKCYGEAPWTSVNAMDKTLDGGFILAGCAGDSSNAQKDIYLLKTNANGDSLWSLTIGDTIYNEVANDIKQTNDNGYIIAAQKTYSVDSIPFGGYSCAWLLKLGPEPEGITTEPIVPVTAKLFQNYPNPFNPETVISYQLTVSSPVELAVYNSLGQKVKNLVHQKQLPGDYQVHWDGTNQSDQPVSSGIYIYRIQAGKWSETKKMVVIR